MITDIGSTIQNNFMPNRYCQSSTDTPNDAPNESATVPTITSAATKLRVMIEHDNENKAKRTDHRDQQIVSRSRRRQSLIGGRGAGDKDIGFRQRCAS